MNEDPPVLVGGTQFKTILNVVVGLTLLCFATYIGLAALGNGTETQESLRELCDFGFKAGFGAILGLLGGKAA